jgi:hypothetical protein
LSKDLQGLIQIQKTIIPFSHKSAKTEAIFGDNYWKKHGPK